MSPAGVFTSTLKAWMLTSLGILTIIFLCAWVWYQLGPQSGITPHRVPASSIKASPVSGSACGGFGTVVSAYQDSNGLFQVTCSSGVTTLVGQP